jgi:MFS family permease
MMHMKKSFQTGVFLPLMIMGFFAILSSTMSKSPVLKPFTLYLGTPTDWTGIVAAASTIPGILISLPAASLSDVYGRRRVLLVAAAVFASAPLLYLLIAPGYWWQLILVRFYHGFATAIFVPVAEASVAELFPSKRGERISLFMSATYVGRVIAPVLGGYVLFATAQNFHVYYLAVAVAGMTAFVTALPFAVKRGIADPKGGSDRARAGRRMFQGWRTVAQSKGVAAVGFTQAVQYYVYGAVEFYLAGYLPEIVHLDEFRTGLLITSIIGVGIFARPYMGRVSDRIGRRLPIIFGCVASGLPLLAVAFVSDFWILLLLVIVYGFGFATVTASTSPLMCELIPSHLVGTSMGFLDTVMDMGQTLGPIVSGFILATTLRYQGVFPALGIVLFIASAIYALSGVARREASNEMNQNLKGPCRDDGL